MGDPPEWKKVLDLMMEEENILPEDARPDKRKRDEISRGRRKQRREDYIRTEKQEHSPTVSQRIKNSENLKARGFTEFTKITFPLHIYRN